MSDKTLILNTNSGILIISDLHLGAHDKGVSDIVPAIRSIEDKFRILILLGDTIDSPETMDFEEADLVILRYLFQLSQRRQLVIVAGNHDRELLQEIQDVFGTTYYETVLLTTRLSTYLMLHGDMLDERITKAPRFNRFLVSINGVVNTFLGKKVSSFFSKVINFMSSPHKEVLEDITKLLEDNDVDYIICGHTHQMYLSDTYINVGSQTQPPGQRTILLIRRNADPTPYEIIRY